MVAFIVFVSEVICRGDREVVVRAKRRTLCSERGHEAIYAGRKTSIWQTQGMGGHVSLDKKGAGVLLKFHLLYGSDVKY